MKRTILIAFAALVALYAMASGNSGLRIYKSSGNSISMQADENTISIVVDSVAGTPKAMVVVNGDTTITADLDKDLAGQMNDTLYASSTYYYSDKDSDEGLDKYDYYLYKIRNEQRETIQTTSISLTAIVFGSIFLIVISCLIVYYLNRRSRMKVIEKAIENNYQLPDSFYTGSNNTSSRQSGEAECGTNDATQQQPSMNMAQQIFNYNNYRETRNGVTLTIVGLGLILVFAFLGWSFMAALSVIPFLIGVSRILPFFLTRRGGMPVPPPQPQQPQQPNTANPVPPTFTHNNTVNQQEDNK